jgi:chaperonin cofactor prefoldin
LTTGAASPNHLTAEESEVTQTIVGGNEQLVVRVRDLERRNKALDAKVTELQKQVRTLESSAHPLNVRISRALQPS